MANEIYHRSNWGNAVNDIAWGDTYEKFDATNEMFVRSNNYENSNETDKLMAAINPKPSILLTPTAYDNGSLHSVKPVKTFGSELVTNGDFSDGANDWTNATSDTFEVVDGGVGHSTSLHIEVSAINRGAYQSAFVADKTYYVSLDLKVVSGSVYIGKNTRKLNNQDYNNSDWQTITGYLTAIDDKIRIYGNEASEFYVDNVSVKEVIDADFDFTRGSSATRVNEQGLIEDVQILSGELVQNGDFEQIGSELVTNGDFATDSDWVKNTGWSISGGAANASSSFDSLAQAGFNFIIEKNYKVTYEVKNYVNGNIRFQFTGGATLTGTTRNSNGIYTQYVKATANHSNFRFKGTNFTGSIDNVSVKEVGQNWVVTDGWSIENGKANIDTSQGTDNFNQLGVLTVGKKYRLSLNAAMTVGRVKFQSDAAGVFIFSSDVSNHEFIASSTSVSFRRFDATTSGYIDNVSIIEITDDTDLPRIDYTDGTGSLLLEPQSSNLITYSEDASQWTSIRGTTTNNNLIAPNGELVGNLYEKTENANEGYVYNDLTVSNVGTYSASLFFKYNNSQYAHFLIWDRSTSGARVWFDIQNGVVGTSATFGSTFTVSDLNIENYGNGWYRCSAKYVVTGTDTTWQFRVSPSGGNGVTNSDSGAKVYFFGAQLEEQSYPTSYIPTLSGSTVTRNSDVCNNSGSSDLINSTEGVLYAEIKTLTELSTFRQINLNDGTAANRIYISKRGNNNNLEFRMDNPLGSLNFSIPKNTTNNYLKLAFRYGLNNFAVFIDGVSQNVSSTGNTFSANTLNNLELTSPINQNFEGKVKCIAVFKEALTDEELTALTT